MEQQPTEWLRDGRTVYIVKSHGYNKWNAFTLYVQASDHELAAAEERLAESIKDLLNSDIRFQETVQDIVARVMDGHGL